MKAAIVGNIKKLNPGLNGIKHKGIAFCIPFFYCLQIMLLQKMHTYISPRQGLLDKRSLSSKLDKILSRDISGILKIKMR